MYSKWVQNLTESYINSKIDLTESEMILEELNETKEYAYILEHVLNTLLEHEIISEEMIMEALSPMERFRQARRMGLDHLKAKKRMVDRHNRLSGIEKRKAELSTDLTTAPPLRLRQWHQANEILKSSDPDAPTIGRRVPEGSPEEVEVVDTGLINAGLYYNNPSYLENQKTARDNMRIKRRSDRKWRADSKRAARERRQG